MKLGILCYASQTGLGYQTKDYAEHLNPSKLMIIDLSQYNKMPIFRDWYKDFNTQWVSGIPTTQDIDRFLNALDVVFMAETPLNNYLFEAAKARGIKTVNAYNYEFLDYFRHPEWQGPTVLAGPTVWNIDIVKGLGKSDVIHLPVPIQIDHPARQIKECKTLFHIIGRPAVHDRNGTLSFLEAAMRLGNEFNYIVYYQTPSDPRAIEYFAPVKQKLEEVRKHLAHLSYFTDTENNADLFQNGDLLILPRRYGGLCLPMQEALSWGVPVVMTDVSPNNAILPEKWLVKSAQKDTFRGHADILVYEADVEALVANITQFKDVEFIQEQSRVARQIAESQSWEVLKPRYLQCFSE